MKNSVSLAGHISGRRRRSQPLYSDPPNLSTILSGLGGYTYMYGVQ